MYFNTVYVAKQTVIKIIQIDLFVKAYIELFVMF